jgi:hypothetical protein
MFASWALDLGSPDIGHELGFRNGIGKDLTLGFCAGTNVFVCSNLQFSGDFIVFRKHTSGLDYEEVVHLAQGAIQNAVVQMQELEDWQRSLHDFYVPENDFKQLAFDMIMKDAFGPSKLRNYVEAVKEEMKVEHGKVLDGCRSLYAVHGGATRILRGSSLQRISDTTSVLNSICDDYIEYKKAA